MKRHLRRLISSALPLIGMIAIYQNCSKSAFNTSSTSSTPPNVNSSTQTNFGCAQPATACTTSGGAAGSMSCQNGNWGPCTPVSSSASTSAPSPTNTGAGTVPTQPTAPSNCNFKGNVYVNGQSFIAYAAAQAIFPAACQSISRTCMNGSISGNNDYQYLSCSQLPPVSSSSGSASSTPRPPATCYLGDQTVRSGGSLTAYSAAVAPAGQSCDSIAQTRYCSSGSLSGSPSFSFTSCSAVQPAPTTCTFAGANVPNDTTVAAWEAETVTTPAVCKKQFRHCSNGTLDGNYAYSACTVAQPRGCSGNLTWGMGQTAHGTYCQQCIGGAGAGSMVPLDSSGLVANGYHASISTYPANNGLADSWGSYSATCVDGNWVPDSASCDATCGKDAAGNEIQNCSLGHSVTYDEHCVPR